MPEPLVEEIVLSDDRIGRVYFQIHAPSAGGDSCVAGKLMRDLKGVEVWHRPVANVIRRDDGTLWVERASFDTTNQSAPIPDSYLASSLDSLRQFASLFFDAAQLAFVSRSHQWRAAEAQRKLDEWLGVNAPRCLDDPGSYLNEIQSDEY